MFLQRRAGSLTPAAEAVLVMAGFAALALAATYPLVRQLTTALPNDLGDPLLNTWILAWDAGRLAHAFRGVWDAPIFFPYARTLAYSEHLIGIAIFTAPIEWATGNPVLAFNAAFIGSFVLAGGGMYLLARTLTGRRDAAFVAGLIFAFTPYRFAHIAHIQMLASGWMPISLWALHRYWSTGAWRFLFVSGLAYVLLALSNLYFLYFGVLPLIIVGAAGLLKHRRRLGRTILHAVPVAVLVLVAFVPVVRTYYRVRQDNGFVRRPDEILQFSAAVEDYARGHAGVWIWRQAGGVTSEHELFPGAVALLLTVAAMATAWRRNWNVRVYAALALVALVLSLGPAPTAWGHVLPFAGPYGWLLTIVPGLDGMRAVGRLNMVVVLALAVLSAFGATWVLDQFVPGRRAAVACALAAIILAEGWAAPIRTAAFDPAGDPGDRDLYAYLAQAPPGAVLELPIGVPTPAVDLTYQYMTLMHGHPIVNGSSGYETPLLRLLHGDDSAFSDLSRAGDTIDMLRAIGVRYVVVHPDACMDGSACGGLIAALGRDTARVPGERRFARATAFNLAPLDIAPLPETTTLRRLPASAFRAQASRASDRLPFLFDDDPDSRWLTGAHQSGDEWIQADFDRPRDVRRVRLQMAARSLGDYPRELAIDVVEDGATRAVMHGSVLAQYARSLVADGNYPIIDLVLPPNRSTSLRVRQLGATRTAFWSVHELQLWEDQR